MNNIKLSNIDSTILFLELLRRKDIVAARGFGSRIDDFEIVYDSYQIQTKFHLTDEQWEEHFNYITNEKD